MTEATPAAAEHPVAPATAPSTAATRPGRDRPTAGRLLRELDTMEAMIAIHCAEHHGGHDDTCADCKALLRYATKRLAVCPYGADKPVCAKCEIHCYAPDKREQVREVMRSAGPKMVVRHPLLALGHVLDKRHVAPPKPRTGQRRSAA